MAVASPLLDPDPKLRPDDPSQPGILEVEAEWQALLAALADLKRAARARLLPQATLPALDDGLGERVAVLHLYAHGGVGRVLLEDAAGRGVEVAAGQLRAPVRRAGLRLAFLESCLTGAELLPPQEVGGNQQRAPSVARVLLDAGVPAAVAMQTPVLVEAGRRFTAAFYRDLARGGSPNEAAALARRRLWAEAKEADLAPWSWAVPALYLRAPAEWATAPLAQGAAGALAVTDPRPRPAGFPQPAGPFVGRRAEQVEILEALDWGPGDEHPRVLCLLGSGGVGKTALALAAGGRLLPRLGSGGRAVWAAARPVLPPGGLPQHVTAAMAHHLAMDEREFLAGLAVGLGLAREAAGRLAAGGLAAWIAADLREGPRTLLVLDNLESLFEEREEAYRLAPATAGLLADLPRQARALCTSRQALEVNEGRLTLEPLLPYDAGRLARSYAGLRRIELGAQAMTSLVVGTGGHPLAVRLVIALIADLAAPDVKGALERLLSARERAAGDEDFYRYLYGESLERAGADGQALFAALSLFAGHGRRDALAAALEWQDGRLGPAMARLRDLSLALEVELWDGEGALLLEPPARAEAARLLGGRAEGERVGPPPGRFLPRLCRSLRAGAGHGGADPGPPGAEGADRPGRRRRRGPRPLAQVPADGGVFPGPGAGGDRGRGTGRGAGCPGPPWRPSGPTWGRPSAGRPGRGARAGGGAGERGGPLPAHRRLLARAGRVRAAGPGRRPPGRRRAGHGGVGPQPGDDARQPGRQGRGRGAVPGEPGSEAGRRRQPWRGPDAAPDGHPGPIAGRL